MIGERSTPRLFALLMAGGLCGLNAGLAVAADEAAGTAQEQARLVDLLGVDRPLVSDEVLKSVARELTQGQGAQLYVEPRKVRLLPLRAAALEALQKNLSITVGHESAELVEQAIKEADAIFNPTFLFNVGFDQSTTYERSHFGTVSIQTFSPCFFGCNGDPLGFGGPSPLTGVNGSITIPPDILHPGTPRVNLLQFIQVSSSSLPPGHLCNQDPVLASGFCMKEVDASTSSKTGPTRTMKYSVEVDQQLPWGPSFSVGLFTTDHKVYYNQAQRLSFNRPYATTMVFNMTLPVPGGKDFGPQAPNDVSLRQAEKSAERAVWDLRSIINSTLLEVDNSYWQLVRSIENLAVVIDNRQHMEKIAEHTAHLYSQGLTTAYGKAQVDAELANLKTEEEAAKVAVITASNNLAPLLETSGESTDPYLILPRDYLPLLDKLLVVDAGQAVQQGLAHRPDLAAERVSKEQSEIALEFQRHQLRPDLKLTANVTAAQDNSQIGYRTYWKSIGAVGDPDTLSKNYNLNYHYPWGNRAFKAQFVQAEKSDEAEALTVRNVENTVGQQVNDALAAVFAARAQVDITEKNVNFAQTAYDKLVKRREIGGDVRELELVTKSQELLAARLNHINALINNKIAESNLLAAQGIIAAAYGEATAPSSVDIQRLESLAGYGVFKYFPQIFGHTTSRKTTTGDQK
ncbi:MAG TPA: TolC family protein [Gammaproteobacteria bacterium]|nr:TolC family protein [Gammaproteobacteria bacterium]